MIIDSGAYPSPLGYGGFPKSVCTSVNECMCHGIPDSRQLQVSLLCMIGDVCAPLSHFMNFEDIHLYAGRRYNKHWCDGLLKCKLLLLLLRFDIYIHTHICACLCVCISHFTYRLTMLMEVKIYIIESRKGWPSWWSKRTRCQSTVVQIPLPTFFLVALGYLVLFASYFTWFIRASRVVGSFSSQKGKNIYLYIIGEPRFCFFIIFDLYSLPGLSWRYI